MKYSDSQIEGAIDKLAQATRSPQEPYSARKSYPLLRQQIKKRKQKYFLRIASSAAAVILLCIASWSIYTYHHSPDILTISTLAEVKEVALPDGSKVILNRYTSLSYPNKFNKKNREVQLSGEAYFDVTKDKTHPFIVKTAEINVQVLGTEFNIEAYPKDELIKTTLFEGSVAVSSDEENLRLILVPNESAIYHKGEKKLDKEQTLQINDEIAWQNNAFNFNDLPLKEIARQLSNAFKVTIQITSPELSAYKISARFVNGEGADEILSLLQMVGNFTYTREQQTITISKNN